MSAKKFIQGDFIYQMEKIGIRSLMLFLIVLVVAIAASKKHCIIPVVENEIFERMVFLIDYDGEYTVFCAKASTMKDANHVLSHLAHYTYLATSTVETEKLIIHLNVVQNFQLIDPNFKHKWLDWQEFVSTPRFKIFEPIFIERLKAFPVNRYLSSEPKQSSVSTRTYFNSYFSLSKVSEKLFLDWGNEDYIFLDIDETVLTQMKDPNTSQIISILYEEHIGKIIRDWRERGINVFFLTARNSNTVSATLQQMSESGIVLSDFSDDMKNLLKTDRMSTFYLPKYFDGVIFCGNVPKGKALLFLLKCLNIKPKRMALFDDRFENHLSIFREFDSKTYLESIHLLFSKSHSYFMDQRYKSIESFDDLLSYKVAGETIFFTMPPKADFQKSLWSQVTTKLTELQIEVFALIAKHQPLQDASGYLFKTSVDIEGIELKNGMVVHQNDPWNVIRIICNHRNVKKITFFAISLTEAYLTERKLRGMGLEIEILLNKLS